MTDLSNTPTVELRIEYLPLAELRPDPTNPRQHGKRHVRQIAKSIEAFGFNAPILIDDGKQIVGGHGRHAAAILLGLLTAPTICLGHLSPQQRRAYMVADNRLGDLSKWDGKALAGIMLELAEADLSFDIEAAGFSVGEIDLMVAEADGADDADDEIPEPGPIITQLSDVWELGEHLVLAGSALDESSYSAIIDQDGADLVFSDPPYNVPIQGHVSGLGKIQHREFAQAAGEMSKEEFIRFLNTALKLAARASRDGSLHYWAMDWRHQYELSVAARAVYDEQINLCVWSKTAAGMGSLYRSQHELFAVWRKGKARHRNNVELGRFGRSRSNVWSYPGANSFGRSSDEGNLLALHPTVKPVALIADAILDSTRRGDIVLDPFLGSGSTLIAAEKVGRNCRGIELDPAYVDTIIRRWQRWSGGHARRRSDGRLFDNLEIEAFEQASLQLSSPGGF
jgi:DNA modification methylase